MLKDPKKERTILVIEDERPLVQAIQAKLERSGFSVVTARTVEQGLNYLEEIPSIEAVWLDHYLLGKETGLDFVAKLKSPGSKWKKLPIFVVSNTASSTNVQSYLRLGVSVYSVKADSRLDETVAEIKSFLENPKE
ncbi:MAG: response regulator [bacterium]|nr:response regulator [bacterium]